MGHSENTSTRTNTTTLKTALRESEERLALVLRASNDGIWDWNVATDELYLAPRWLEMLGFTEEELEPHIRTLENVCHPEDLPELRQALHAQLEGDSSQAMEIEHRVRTKSGKEMWFLTRGGVGSRDAHDKVLRVAGGCTDITDRKQAEEELREHRDLLDELVAQRTLELAETNAQLQFDIAKRKKAEEKLQESNTMLAEAVEREKRISTQLKAAMHEAEAASRTKSEFLANMSHEIRTPMNGVMGLTELVLATDLTVEQREYLSIAMESSRSLLALLNDILDLSKVEAGKLEMETIEFNPVSTLESVVDLLARDASEKGLEFICYAHPDVPTRLSGDPGRVRQVLVNLAGNAIKFTERGEVEVSAKVSKQADGVVTLLFTVRDTGIGISEERKEDIFGSFTQADGTITRKYGGTGLGLTISKQLVELMEGNIWVESEVGRGSTFNAAVPFDIFCKTDAPTERDAVQLSHANRFLDGKRTLVVGDGALTRRVLCQMLESWGCSSESVSESEEALDLLRTNAVEGHPFDLVVLDMQTPQREGFQFGRTIESDSSLCKPTVVILSPPGSRKEWKDLEESPHVTIANKPVKQSAFQKALMRIYAGPDGSALGGVSERQTTANQRRFRSRVLLIDDNATNRKVTSGILRNGNHDVTMVDNGLAALETLERKSFDLIITDLQMPGLDGFELTRRIRASDRWQTLRVIAMTAHAMQGDRERCLEAGMDDYLTKPVSADELMRMVDKWTSKPDTACESSELPQRASSSGAGLDSESKAPLDVGKALKQLGGDQDLLFDALNAFIEDVPHLVNELQAAVSDADTKRFLASAHTLKGAASAVCAEPTRCLSQQLERLGEQGEIDQAGALLSELQRHMERLQEFAASFTVGKGGDQ